MTWGGPLFGSDSNKRRGEVRPPFELSPGPLLKSGLEPLARYCNHQITINRRPEQVYLPSDQDWNNLEKGLYLSQTRINARGKMRPRFRLSHGQVLKSDLGPLVRYGTHQETISGRPKQKYLSSDQRFEWPADGPLFKSSYFRKLQLASPDR